MASTGGSEPQNIAASAVHESAARPEATKSAPSLLDAVLFQSAETDARGESTGLGSLLESETLADALRAWLRLTNRTAGDLTLRQTARILSREIAAIDAAISRQLNRILHHPRFQKLEASWRGLRYLIDHQEDPESTHVRVLNADWKQLVRDLDRSIEFDQSQLFQKVYSEEFGNPGGIPFSLLVGDYEIRAGVRPGQPMPDLEALRLISQVAAAAFAPFVAAAHPSLLSLSRFAELHRPTNWEAIFDQPEFIKWRSLRTSPDSRFVGLTLPRVMIRAPYGPEDQPGIGFRFEEEVAEGAEDHVLWGNPSYCFAAVAMRSFARTRWPCDIRGVRRDSDEGGLVSGLPVFPCRSGEQDRIVRCPVETVVTDQQEAAFSELGFLPLSHCKDSNNAAFYSSASIQKADAFDDSFATVNARISSMMQYMLCVSHIAHYIKVLGRDKIGSYMDPVDCENFLHGWLQQYITQDDQAPQEIKAQYPLRDARVEVREHPAKPGHYFCQIHLQPHYQLDDIVSAITLATELAPLE